MLLAFAFKRVMSFAGPDRKLSSPSCAMSSMIFSVYVKSFAATTAFIVLCATVCASARAETADELIKAGEIYDLKLQAPAALSFYLSAERLEPKNVHLLVCIARQYRHLMADAPSREEKLKLGAIALEYSQRAAALAPGDSEAQLAPAISYGKLLPLQSLREQAQESRYIKQGAEKAIKLDPQNDLAWHVLGRFHMVLASVTGIKRAMAQLMFGELPAASNEDAVKCFKKAIEINPTRLMHYIELGQTYAQMGRAADARVFITQGLAMPDVDKDDPEIKHRGRETLAKLQ
jgi:tetratricopeptide (TPR) repeat protein